MPYQATHIVVSSSSRARIKMMKSAEHRRFDNSANRFNITMIKRVPVQRLMRSCRVVAINVLAKSPKQMSFTQRNDMVRALAPNRSDHTLDESVLPR